MLRRFKGGAFTRLRCRRLRGFVACGPSDSSSQRRAAPATCSVREAAMSQRPCVKISCEMQAGNLSAAVARFPSAVAEVFRAAIDVAVIGIARIFEAAQIVRDAAMAVMPVIIILGRDDG